MRPRAHLSSVSASAAAGKRDRVIEAAAKMLREEASNARLSLGSRAQAARVERVTGYKQVRMPRGFVAAAVSALELDDSELSRRRRSGYLAPLAGRGRIIALR